VLVIVVDCDSDLVEDRDGDCEGDVEELCESVCDGLRLTVGLRVPVASLVGEPVFSSDDDRVNVKDTS